MRIISVLGITTLILSMYMLPLSAHESDVLSDEQAHKSLDAKKNTVQKELSVQKNNKSDLVNQVTVKLDFLQKIHTQEKWGDEIYIGVTEFSDNERPRFKQIPSFPSHWTSSHLEKVKDVVLWQKQMKECRASTVIFSLVEQDMTPWDPDDLLGSVQLNVSCEPGKMQTKWSIPNVHNTALMQPSINGFVFKNKGAEYRAAFNVEQNKAPLDNKNTAKEPLIQLRERLLFP